MNGSMIQVVIRRHPSSDFPELLSFQLNEIGFTGFLEQDDLLFCYIPWNAWIEKTQQSFAALMESYQKDNLSTISTSIIEERNWNAEWEESIQPIQAGRRFIIAPSWSIPESDREHILLVIDPKMSFGTGHHESTRIILRMMERLDFSGKRVLDIGTGTGILAIAAAKIGAQSIEAIDHDEWSVNNGLENIKRNNVSEKVTITLGSLDDVTGRDFDIIIANIHLSVIVEMLPRIAMLLHKKSYLLFSGLLLTDREAIEQACLKNRLQIASIEKENEWMGLLVVKISS